ncbi:hypothetical protein SAMN04488066_12237 [Halorubrum aquaticum]|uniref:Uncharacterized protein n=1 Tax=Halorubrum aquaticum TaxID=387340 RepID=A0A1I3CG62_9EURY|nr:hypothetical protein [Halorubrum aquaticum]SFH73530.1 hypothetical protein SAMN04488066_12237 [Halorubrum aquaticum]
MQRKTAAVALLLVVGAGLVLSGVLGGTAQQPGPGEVPEESLIAVEGDHELWPYTSRRRSVYGQTLAINVVFLNDAETVERALTADPETDWQETNASEETDEFGQGYGGDDGADRVSETRDGNGSDPVRDIVEGNWETATGSDRYSYFRGPDGGVWKGVTFEVHDGTYLGTRDHVRAYESPDGEYTAVQVHEEYYDWFRLRHTVPSIDEPATRLEDEFIDNPTAAVVSREYRGIDGGWSDGWLSVIELTLLLPTVGALLSRRTREAVAETARRLRREADRHASDVVLAVALAGVFVSIRHAGVALEVAYPTLPPKAIAAPLYLVIAVGLPALVVSGTERSDPTAAFLAVVLGLGAGFVLDFAALGVAVPPGLIVHRVAVLAALGLVAVGRATTDRSVLVAGALAWVLGLALPLADVI